MAKHLNRVDAADLLSATLAEEKATTRNVEDR
jgi:ferritin-like metal-binding protein YciE